MQCEVMSHIVTPYAWDSGLDFQKTRLMLLQEIEKCVKHVDDKVYRKRLLYLVVLYTQLCNGCRVSEACETVLKWLSTRSREVRVKVRKRKDLYERLVIIPREISHLHAYLVEFTAVNVKDLTRRVKTFATRTLRINTHALRYAWITYASKELKLTPQEISKITGHKKLDYIAHYIQRERVEDILRRMLL